MTDRLLTRNLNNLVVSTIWRVKYQRSEYPCCATQSFQLTMEKKLKYELDAIFYLFDLTMRFRGFYINSDYVNGAIHA